MMAGRGFGKTRAGSEWINRIASGKPGVRIALVGATIQEARNVMVEGVSGLLQVAKLQRCASDLGAEPGPVEVAERERSAALFRERIRMGCGGRSMILPGALQVLDVLVGAAVERLPRKDTTDRHRLWSGHRSSLLQERLVRGRAEQGKLRPSLQEGGVTSFRQMAFQFS